MLIEKECRKATKTEDPSEIEGEIIGTNGVKDARQTPKTPGVAL